MVLVLKKGASKKEIESLEKKLKHKNGVEVIKYFGSIKLKEDAIIIQKSLRNEWQQFTLDTNAVLYVLGGDETLASFLNGKELYLSIISELELLSYKKLTQKDAKVIASFLSELKIENISEEIKKHTIQIRKDSILKLPDCIIAATSLALGIPLVTTDKQLCAVLGLDIILYEKQHII